MVDEREPGRDTTLLKDHLISLTLGLVMWSDRENKIILVEMTVMLKDSCNEDWEREVNKYHDLVQQCRDK